MHATIQSLKNIAQWIRSQVEHITKCMGSFVRWLYTSGLALIRWVYTVGLALGTLSLVIVTLAAYQFQTRITEIEDRSLMRAEIEAKNAEASASSKNRNADAGALTKVELASELRALQADYRIFRHYADDRWAVFLDAERRVSDELRPVLYAQIRTERRTVCPWLRPLNELAVPDTDARLIAMTSQPVLASASPSFTPAGADNAALTSAVEAHREYLNYEKLIHELTPNKDEYPDLFTLYQDMVYFDHLRMVTLGFIDPMTLAVMPPWMLTLIVTLAMGALGSLLHVARSYLDETCEGRNKPLPMSWFFLRPLLGVVTAFAVFVFLQAGLALTDGKVTQGTLNPFFIAFIAILSGLMSWQALESIQRWGEKFLGKESEETVRQGAEDPAPGLRAQEGV